MEIVLAIIGTVATVGALGWAIWSHYRKPKGPPRPASVLTLGWDRTKVSGFTERRVPFVTVTLHNKGETSARDLRITVDTATRDNSGAWEYLLTLEKDSGAFFSVPMVRVESDEKNDHRPVDGVTPILTPVVTVDWMDYSDEPRRSDSWTITGTGY